MRRVLIANRGEIALRAARACRALGLQTVAGFSSADAGSAHVFAADEAVCIGPPVPKASYLNADALIAAACGSGCDAVYPGYGFLSENSGFAEKCRAANLTFIGPAPEVIALMGNKAEARRAVARLGVPVVPGSQGGFTDAAAAQSAADDIGFPLLLKAVAGGGGRGMRVVQEPTEFQALFQQAAAEAQGAFGHPEIYLERFFPRVRHIEIQVMGDQFGHYTHLWERDCSVQRRHQKLIEEAPSPTLSEARRREMTEAAVTIASALEYTNAGTVEFIYDLESDHFFFIEMNTRIQVEHPVTELMTGVDLVQEQFRVADGKPLSFASPPPRAQVSTIEFRINAEDAEASFRPTPGRITVWAPFRGPGIRLDSHVYADFYVSPYYDSMLGKLIVSGETRNEAIERAALALAMFRVEGVATTLPFHSRLIRRTEFRDAQIHTRWIDEGRHL